MSREYSTRAFLEFTWQENQIAIMCDLLNDEDIDLVNTLKTSDQSYFNRLDTRDGFVDEVAKLCKDRELYRAFWIMNLVYLEYFRKPKYNNVMTFYQVRWKRVQQQRTA